MVGVDNDRIESSIIKEVTKVIDRSKRGKEDKDTGICITRNGRVRQASKVSKVGDIVGSVTIIEIPREDDKEDEGIEENPGVEI